MRIVSALSGELLAEGPDAAQAAADALQLPRELLRITITECSVVVLAGKALCRRCRAWAMCTCGARAEGQCRCEAVVESEVFCGACQDRLNAVEAAEDAYQALKEEGTDGCAAPRRACRPAAVSSSSRTACARAR
jgi:hypothetical protein